MNRPSESQSQSVSSCQLFFLTFESRAPGIAGTAIWHRPNGLKERCHLSRKVTGFRLSPSYCFLPRNSGGFANFDLIAEFFDSAREALRGSLLVDAREIERTGIPIRHLVAK